MNPVFALLRVLLGLLIIGLTFFAMTYVGTELAPVHDFSLLKWVPVLIVIVGFGLAGLVTQRVPIAWLILILPSLLLFQLMDFFYFPFMLILAMVAVLMLLGSRTEIGKSFRRVAVILSIGIFGYFLFSQPLIIYEQQHGVSNYGDLIGAKTLWGSYGGEQYLPEHSFIDLEGKIHSTDSWKGKRVYVSFWATWCGPCIQKMPELEELKARFKDDEDIFFVDISLDDDKDAWENFLLDNRPSGLQLLSSSPARTRHLLGIDALPENMLIDPQGRFVSGITLEGAKELIVLKDSDLAKFMQFEDRTVSFVGQE